MEVYCTKNVLWQLGIPVPVIPFRVHFLDRLFIGSAVQKWLCVA